MLNDFLTNDYKDYIDNFNSELRPLINKDISELMTLVPNKPDEEVKKLRFSLNKTEIAQPAILLHCYLSYQRLTKEVNINKIKYLFGSSLGELIALVIAESIDLNSAGRLLYNRGKLMQQSCPLGKGSMLNVVGDIGKNIDLFNEFKRDIVEGEYIDIATIHSKRLIVISGKTEIVDDCGRFFKTHQIACRKLPVSAAFHSSLMKSGQREFDKYLKEVGIVFKPPKIPIISTIEKIILSNDSENFDGTMKRLLVKQFTEKVDNLTCLQISHDKELPTYDLITRKFIDYNDFL
jgi:malonyl CoA-acyl carrier protein transacylase